MLNQRLAKIRPTLENWWQFGDQKNPCINCTVIRKDAAIPDTDDLVKFWSDVDFVINRMMAVIDASDCYGQAVPLHYVDFASSAMACALGARIEYLNKETVWAYPHLDSLDDVLKIKLSDDNEIYKIILEITRRSSKLSHDHHFVTNFALGGLTDTLASLYGTENLLMDMINNPEGVKRAMTHLKNIWLQAFGQTNKIIDSSGNSGGIGWAGIWSPGTTFPLQEDFSYMISPAMFNEFCLPHLLDLIDEMDYPLYHLDGIGAIGHLDSLLKIPKLKAIQWVPGAGKEEIAQWYDLIKHILAHGKSVQLFAQADEVEPLVKNVGARGLLITCWRATQEQAEALIQKYGDK